jgi:hypothetical protein
MLRRSLTTRRSPPELGPQAVFSSTDHPSSDISACSKQLGNRDLRNVRERSGPRRVPGSLETTRAAGPSARLSVRLGNFWDDRADHMRLTKCPAQQQKRPREGHGADETVGDRFKL